MKLDWGMVRGRLGLWSGRMLRGAAALGVLVLGGLLAAKSAEARKERAGLELRHRALDREVARLERRNTELREEIRALSTDPVYVESLLRRWRYSAPSERIVE
jgi:cell division protein FtsB